MIFFTTGNGSITNFPFVPTIKVVTTTGRYDLLSKDMDVNAGAYLDGIPMDELGQEMFERTLRAASGEKTVGERAGHSQVSIWRDWKQTSPEHLEELQNAPEPDGEPLPVEGDAPELEFSFEAIETDRGPVTDQIGLVMPTSLCSGQIARRIANRLNERRPPASPRARLPASSPSPTPRAAASPRARPRQIYSRTVLGHLANPSVRFALLLEHGCEKTHNDYFESRLTDQRPGPRRASAGPASSSTAASRASSGRSRTGSRRPSTRPTTWRTRPPGSKPCASASMPRDRSPEDAARSLASVTRAVVGVGRYGRRPREGGGALLTGLPGRRPRGPGRPEHAGLRAAFREARAARHGGPDGPLDRDGHRPWGHGGRGHAGARLRAPPAGAPHDTARAGLLRPPDDLRPRRRPRRASRGRPRSLVRDRCWKSSRPWPPASTRPSSSAAATPTSSSPAACWASRCRG